MDALVWIFALTVFNASGVPIAFQVTALPTLQACEVVRAKVEADLKLPNGLRAELTPCRTRL